MLSAEPLKRSALNEAGPQPRTTLRCRLRLSEGRCPPRGGGPRPRHGPRHREGVPEPHACRALRHRRNLRGHDAPDLGGLRGGAEPDPGGNSCKQGPVHPAGLEPLGRDRRQVQPRDLREDPGRAGRVCRAGRSGGPVARLHLHPHRVGVPHGTLAMPLDLTPWMQQLTIQKKDLSVEPINLSAPFAVAQTALCEEIERQYNLGLPVRIIVLKARQMGMSTAVEGILFNWCFLHPGTRSLVIAHETKATQNLFDMTKLMWEEWPFREAFHEKHNRQKTLGRI